MNDSRLWLEFGSIICVRYSMHPGFLWVISIFYSRPLQNTDIYVEVVFVLCTIAMLGTFSLGLLFYYIQLMGTWQLLPKPSGATEDHGLAQGMWTNGAGAKAMPLHLADSFPCYLYYRLEVGASKLKKLLRNKAFPTGKGSNHPFWGAMLALVHTSNITCGHRWIGAASLEGSRTLGGRSRGRSLRIRWL